MTPLELLFERDGLPGFGLPARLASMYGGDFGVETSHVSANFVSSVDGIVGLRDGGESGHIVSGNSEPDRFVMALLRASVDAVLVGAETFRRASGASWTAESLFPSLGPDLADLRRKLGLAPAPLLVIVTASGKLEATGPALAHAWIATTREGEKRLRGALPATTRVVALDDDTVRVAPLLERLRAEGFRRLLTEGGPTLFGELLAANLVDELFLTSSPRLFGRTATDGKKSLVSGTALDDLTLELWSARRHGSHLFLRYAVRHASPG